MRMLLISNLMNYIIVKIFKYICWFVLNIANVTIANVTIPSSDSEIPSKSNCECEALNPSVHPSHAMMMMAMDVSLI